MRREILILLCVIVLGMGAAKGVTMLGTGTAESTAMSGTEERPRTVAWWSLIFERPNPDRLPVQVHFQWAKGLE